MEHSCKISHCNRELIGRWQQPENQDVSVTKSESDVGAVTTSSFFPSDVSFLLLENKINLVLSVFSTSELNINHRLQFKKELCE